MTSVLYSAGLNYQAGNPVRQEIMAVRREVDSLRKQLEILTEELHEQIYDGRNKNQQRDESKLNQPINFTKDGFIHIFCDRWKKDIGKHLSNH